MPPAVNLNLRWISKCFSGNAVLSNISCTFNKSQTYVLMGVNGSGKTTLLNILSGIIKPDNGEVNYMGENVTGKSSVLLAQKGISRTFQSVKLCRALSVEDNLLLALRGKKDESLFCAVFGHHARYSGLYKQKTDSLLYQLNLENIRNNLAGELSYGQQKLLSLAMALANPFEILLLDEPVTGLQPNYVSKIASMLKKMDKTIILVDHNVDFIKELSAKVIFLGVGKIIDQGTYEQVINNPQVKESYF